MPTEADPLGDPGQETREALIARVDSDRWFATRLSGDVEARERLLTLYAFEHELDRAAKVASQPLIAEIRLTWWAEALDEIASGRPVRAHPLVRDLAGVIVAAGLDPERLQQVVEGRIQALTVGQMDAQSAKAWAEAAGVLAGQAALCLDSRSRPDQAEPAGQIWALARLAAERRLDPELAVSLIKSSLPAARALARRLPAAAFPAVAHAAASRLIARPHTAGALRRRMAIMLAAASGRI